LSIHYLTVFGLPGSDILTEEWEKRELEQELRKRGYHRSDQLSLPQAERGPQQEELDLDEPRKVREKRLDEDEFV
jgi:hypothetical protein